MQPITSLSQCDREPIHTPGLIQPHGLLFALDETLGITDMSENVVDYLNDGKPDGLLGTSILDLLETEAYKAFESTYKIQKYPTITLCGQTSAQGPLT